MTAGISARESSEPIVVEQIGRIEYLEAWARQRELADMRADGQGRDTLLLLEHPSVYTAGRRTSPEDRPSDGTPVIEVDRGGKITWHGPGQLVAQPVLQRIPKGAQVVLLAHLGREKIDAPATLAELLEELGLAHPAPAVEDKELG